MLKEYNEYAIADHDVILNNKFTIRPIPKAGESFTSYLLRLANENVFNVLLLVKYFQRIKHRSYHLIDIYPERIIYLEKLMNETNLRKETIYGLSFQPMLMKFAEFDLSSGDNLRLSRLLVQEHRRFCPKCLEEKGYFRLLWQVKEIQVCLEHGIHLTSKCNVCNREQPYMSNSLVHGLCHYCNNKISGEEPYSKVTESEYKHQSVIYNDWETLLNPKRNIVTSMYLPKDKALALKLLYILETKDNHNIKLSTLKYTKKALKGFINNSSSGNPPQIDKTINLIRDYELTIKEFSNINVPSQLESQVIKKVNLRNLGPCLTPWCLSYGTNKSMVKVKYMRIPFEKQYSYKSICTHCLMKFGYNSITGIWEEIGDDISFILNQIKPKTVYATSLTQIINGLPKRRTDKLLGYMAYFNLLTPKFQSRLSPKTIMPDNQIFELFKELLKKFVGFSSMQDYAIKNKLFEPREFNYYYWTPVVQKFLHLERNPISQIESNSDIHVKKIISELSNSNIEITINEVCSRLGYGRKFIYSRGLDLIISKARKEQLTKWKKLKIEQILNLSIEFIKQKEKDGNLIKKSELYEYIGTCSAAVGVEISRKLSVLVKNTNQEIISTLLNRTIENLQLSGETITYQKLSSEIGFHVKWFSRHKKIKEQIDRKLGKID